MPSDLGCYVEPPVGVEPTTYALRMLPPADHAEGPSARPRRHRMWPQCGLTAMPEPGRTLPGEADKPADLRCCMEPPIGVEPMTYALRGRFSAASDLVKRPLTCVDTSGHLSS